jgi:hypothetical protein
MSHKSLFAVGSMLLLLALAAWGAAGQEQIPQMPIVTTASNVVGIGTYVAAQAYAIPAGQDPATQPVQAIILPYGIYPNMMVENIEDFQEPAALVEGFTFTWNLTVPAGSAAELGGETVAHWLADVEGQYVLTLTATDEAGNTATTEWVVTATTYVGVGGIVGDAEEPQCSSCHEETAAAWAATGHATMFTRAIDGLVSNHYSAECITCHTTGFNNRPEAVNGGFDDVAAEAGWTFPETLQPGNWDAMVAEFPQVAALANIQCESCHGPGGAHQAAAGGDDEDESAVSQAGPIGRGLAYGTCAQCHAEDNQRADDARDDGGKGFIGDAGENIIGNDFVKGTLRCVKEALLFGDPFQAVGVGGGERRKDRQQQGDSQTDRPNQFPCRGWLAGLHEVAPRGVKESQRAYGNESFANANERMDARHGWDGNVGGGCA